MTTSERQYGNWTKPRTAGLLGLGAFGTLVLLGAILVAVVLIMFGQALAAIIVFSVAVAWLGTVTVRDRHGMTLMARVGEGLAWRGARSQQRHLYRSGPLGRVPWGTCQLPGLSAATSLSEWRDSHDRPFALVESPRSRSYVVVLASEPEGAALVEPSQIDAWVARWGHWLATLGDEPGLEAASVTIESSADTGARLRRELDENAAPDAPEFAARGGGGGGGGGPSSGSVIRAYVALTYSAQPDGSSRVRGAEEMGRALAPRVASLASTLSETGAGAVHPVSAAGLAEFVRVAYDPESAAAIDDARARGNDAAIRWPDAGPQAHEAGWSSYRHDSGHSVSWVMTSAPNVNITADALAGLLQSSEVVARKRVTLIYRPIDRARAAAITHSDLRAARFNATTSSNPMAGEVLAAERARVASEEQAAGAGLVNFGMLVTLTMTRQQIAAAVEAGERGLAWVEAVAEAELTKHAQSASVLLRRAYGSQDVAFAAALPLGHVLSKHLAAPAEVRESMS